MRWASLLVAGAALSGCTDDAAPDHVAGRADVAVELLRRDTSVTLARIEGDRAVLEAWIHTDGAAVTLDAAGDGWTLSIDAVATGPGDPVTAVAEARDGTSSASLSLQNGYALLDGRVHRLSEWQERNAIAASIAPTALSSRFATLAPYRDAIVAHLAEAHPLFDTIGLYRTWPDSAEPPWPQHDDPRDTDPPGHLSGDVLGLGMTCSDAIRCPSTAPFCVSSSHDDSHGFCTRACADDAHCGDSGRCAMPVIDIPHVERQVMACDFACDACPGLLRCDIDAQRCAPHL